MPGTFVFRPIEANLTHDTDWLGKMDPYCAYMINNQRIKGQVCKSGGKHPIWNDATTVPMENDQPACVVELMDKDTFIDDSIGTFVIDLTEVQNLGSVSKWYPVFHKNKPAGQILFEAAFQPAAIPVQEPVIQETVVVQEVPKRTVVEETVIQKEVFPQETFTQSSFVSRGGVIPVGSEKLDGGLYGKVVHAEPVSRLPDKHITNPGLMQDNLPRTELGGPLSGSLAGGVLGSRDLPGREVVGGTQVTRTEVTTTQIGGTQLPESQFRDNQFRDNQFRDNQFRDNQFRDNQFRDNQFRDNQFRDNKPLDNPLLNNQAMGTNLPQNFNSTAISNAQLGGGAPLYRETATNQAQGDRLTDRDQQRTSESTSERASEEANIIPGDLVGGHTQTNRNLGNQPL